MKVWKLFRDGNAPRTLYHSHRGSTALPLDTVLTAPRKVVTNPGSKENARRFVAGFHGFGRLDDLVQYCKRMNPEYVIVLVEFVSGVRKKPGSRGNVLLAKEMSISRDGWERRQKLGEILKYSEYLNKTFGGKI